MRCWFTLLLWLFPTISLAMNNTQRLRAIHELKRIAFGSCSNQKEAQPLWTELIRQKPDIWIWGGDNIYADWTTVTMEEAYHQQNENAGYKRFKAQTPIIGTWDDHDFAYDNADGNYERKQEAQEFFLDFMEEPSDSPRRTQEGIYTSYTFGQKSREVKIIVLDNRYFKNLDAKYPMLGKTQWDWLEKELTDSKANLHFIVTGLSVLSPLLPYSEEWGETKELNEMLNLLQRTKPKGVVFLTGDKHFSSIFQRSGHLEFMSSGMTHVTPSTTWWYLSKRYPVTYFGLSFGQIDIAWQGNVPVLTMSMQNPVERDVHRSVFRWQNQQWVQLHVPQAGRAPSADNLLAQP